MPVMNKDAIRAHRLLCQELGQPESVSLTTMVRMVIRQRCDAVDGIVALRFERDGIMPMCSAKTAKENPCSCEGVSNYRLSKDGEFSKDEILCGIHFNQRRRNGWRINRISWTGGFSAPPGLITSRVATAEACIRVETPKAISKA